MMAQKTTINILNVLPLPWLAGTERAFITLTDMLCSSGHQVTCLIPPDAASLPELQKISRPASPEILTEKKVSRNFGKHDFLAIRKFRNLIRNKNIQLVIVHSGRMSELFKKAAKGICPVVAMNHGTNPKKTAISDYAFAITTKMQHDILQCGMPEDHIFLLPNCLKIQYPPTAPANHTVPVIGGMGRFVPSKGFDILIEAVYLLHKQGYDFRLKLAGDGPERSSLETLAKKYGLDTKIEFLGWVQDVTDFFSSLDIFCLSSLYESFGIVLLEAMHHHKPIVTTITDGSSCIFTHEKNALMVKKQNPTLLAEALKRVMDDKILRDNLAKNGYQTLVDHYSFEVVAGQLEQHISRIMEK